jgi:hypothetical protein
MEFPPRQKGMVRERVKMPEPRDVLTLTLTLAPSP